MALCGRSYCEETPEAKTIRKKDPTICFDLYGRILGSDEIEI